MSAPGHAPRTRLFDWHTQWIGTEQMAFRGYQKGAGGTVVMHEWWLRSPSR